MLHAVILICALSSPTCERATALDVMSTPIRTAMPTTCFMHAQAFLAQMQMGRDLQADERVRIVCERERT